MEKIIFALVVIVAILLLYIYYTYDSNTMHKSNYPYKVIDYSNNGDSVKRKYKGIVYFYGIYGGDVVIYDGTYIRYLDNRLAYKNTNDFQRAEVYNGEWYILKTTGTIDVYDLNANTIRTLSDNRYTDIIAYENGISLVKNNNEYINMGVVDTIPKQVTAKAPIRYNANIGCYAE